jgi:hypothetical protein
MQLLPMIGQISSFADGREVLTRDRTEPAYWTQWDLGPIGPTRFVRTPQNFHVDTFDYDVAVDACMISSA